MSKAALRGVTGLLERILSTAECTAADSLPNHAKRARTLAQKESSDGPVRPRVVARRGRPSGKARAVPTKEKLTVRIAPHVIAAYRDWSWEARSQLSHLVEQALADYENRRRDARRKPPLQTTPNLIRRPAGD